MEVTQSQSPTSTFSENSTINSPFRQSTEVPHSYPIPPSREPPQAPAVSTPGRPLRTPEIPKPKTGSGTPLSARSAQTRPAPALKTSPFEDDSSDIGGEGTFSYPDTKASAAAFATTSNIRDVIVDLSLNDPEFRVAVSSIVKDTIQEEMSKFRVELKDLLEEIFKSNSHSKSSLMESEVFSNPTQTQTSVQEDLTEDPKYRAIINQAFPNCPIRKWQFHNEQGIVPGLPAQVVSIDMVVRDKNTFLLGVRRKIDVEEAKLILKMGKLYHSQHKNMPLCCVVVTAEITSEASEIAERCKIKVLKV